jgi:UDP-N-acetylmuramoyl-tripeptide--D-alanyl-D-alanine ligase
MKRTPGGLSIIDDAFNSNPDGARMALDVLQRITTGKRIVITPGMIELGDKQVEYNKRLGLQMATAADYVMVVGVYNRDAILAGLAEGGMPEEKIFVADSFAIAQARLVQIARAGDVVLYENDLPDTFK